MRSQFIILILSCIINVFSDYLPHQNLSNSIEISHHSNLVIAENDSIYVFWIEGANKIYSRIFQGNSWTPIIPIYSCNAPNTIEELTASSNGDSIYLFWIETDSMISIYAGIMDGIAFSNIEKIYQTTNLLEKLKTKQGKVLGWLEKDSFFSYQSALNIITLPNFQLIFADSLEVNLDYSLEYDDSKRLHAFWIKNGTEIHFKSQIDSTHWSSTHIIPGLFYFKDINCCFNPVYQDFDISLSGELVTGWYSNGLFYVEGSDTNWSPFEEIMPAGYISPSQEYDISEYPQVLIGSDGKCIVLFQNDFIGGYYSLQLGNIYLAQKDNQGNWIVRRNLFPGNAFINSSALDSKDSLYITFEKDNDIFIGGNDFYVKIDDDADNHIRENFQLYQNYPNPFNLRTNVKYTMPYGTDIKLELFDILGKKVRIIYSGYQDSGTHEISFDGADLSSGIYYYVLSARNNRMIKECLLIK